MGWVTEHAPIASEVNTCIQCGLCLPSCPTFRLTGRETASPRGRLTAMAAVADGFPVDQSFADIMGSCLQCRACEVVCPAFVPFGKTMEAARAEVSAQHHTRGRGVRRLLVGRALRSRRLLRLSALGAWVVQRGRLWFLVPKQLRGGLRGMRPIDARASSIVGTNRSSIGPSRGVAAVLSGCVMDSWFSGVHEATIEVLARAGYDVVVPNAQTCCGALAAHDGWADDARAMAEINVSAFEDADVVVVNSAGCGAHLKEYEHWADEGARVAAVTRDITEVVADAINSGHLPVVDTAGGSVAIQDPCHLRHAQRIIEQPRTVLEAAGLTVVEIDVDGQCCGAAGLYSILEPELSGQLGAAKAAQVVAAGQSVVASANPGCEMQLRSHLADQVRVAHPVELYLEALREAGL